MKKIRGRVRQTTSTTEAPETTRRTVAVRTRINPNRGSNRDTTKDRSNDNNDEPARVRFTEFVSFRFLKRKLSNSLSAEIPHSREHTTLPTRDTGKSVVVEIQSELVPADRRREFKKFEGRNRR